MGSVQPTHMNRLREVIDQSLLEARQPEVEADLCVHSMNLSASCTACVDACPLQAWILDDSQLGLDTSVCDGCGLCISACPEAAIQPLYRPSKYHWNRRDIALAACERAGLDETDAVVPCVHGFGIRDLLILYSHGVKDFMVTCGDCSQCDRGACSRLGQSVTQINRVLEQRGLPPMHYYELSPDKWIYNKNTAMMPAKGPEIGRRSFLRRAVGMLATDRSVEEKLTIDKETWSTPLGRLLPPGDNQTILPFSLAIDINSCNGCDVCVRLCPHQAVTLDLDEVENRPSYNLKPDNCTGCGLCVDGCEVAAISINTWAIPTQIKVDLFQARCPACGTDYHKPQTGRQNKNRLCRVCSLVNHHAKLHQVMD